ncbi:MAG: hypothetical protein V4719_22610 [Planctomycetota bacterium]
MPTRIANEHPNFLAAGLVLRGENFVSPLEVKGFGVILGVRRHLWMGGRSEFDPLSNLFPDSGSGFHAFLFEPGLVVLIVWLR